MSVSSLLQFALWALILGGCASFFLHRLLGKSLLTLTTLLGIGALAASTMAGFQVLIHQQTLSLSVPLSTSVAAGMGPFTLRLDSLSAFFLILIGILGIPASCFAKGYLTIEGKDRSLGVFCGLLLLFLASMMLVVLSNNLLLFILFWECMTLLSFGFVIIDTENADAQRAGWLYMMMTHIGTAFMLCAFLIIGIKQGTFEISALTGLGAHLTAGMQIALLVMLLIAFGTKAGIMPLHIWLPEAHPIAPSHISALMSGVMIKMGLFGLILFTFKVLSPVPYWWGIVIAALGLISALLGIVFAAYEKDYKRLLAYSSIENMGIIFLALGSAIMYDGLGHPQMAVLALFAALFHAMNHTIFKGLLFLASGSVLSRTHTRNLDLLGGLMKKMPFTAVMFLIGALSICSLPPMNGFASKWLLFQILLTTENHLSPIFKIFNPLMAALLGLISALTAATFLKAFTGMFSAMPRSRHAEHAEECTPSMKMATGILAFLCIAVGLFPFVIFKAVAPMLITLTHHSEVTLAELCKSSPFGMTLNGFGDLDPSLMPVMVLVLLGVGMLIARVLPAIMGVKTNTRVEDTWACGVTPIADYEHTASGFGEPIQRVFINLFQFDNWFYQMLYLPIIDTVMRASRKLQRIQTGQIHVYLTYILITLIACMIWIRL